MSNTSARPLKVGLLLPTEELEKGSAMRWSELKAMAQHAEAVGFDSLWLPDHLLFRPNELLSEPGDFRRGMWDCWSLLASVAAVTTRVEIGTLVLCTNFRSPTLLAKMADTVDEVSGGRLILGVGGGWNESELRAFGYPFDHLVSRFDEALQILHTLLRTGSIDFHGKYFDAPGCELRPRGGSRRIGPYADYWNGYSINNVETLAAAHKAVDAACVKEGRDPATLQRTVEMLIDLPGAHDVPDWVQRFRTLVAPPANGAPQELAELLRALSREGVNHVQVWLEPATLAGIDAFVPVLESLDRE